MVKVLFVCTVPALESYSSGILNAAFSSKEIDAYAIVFIEASDSRSDDMVLFQYSIAPEACAKVLLVRFPKNRIYRQLMAGRYMLLVANFAKLNRIKIAHFISQDVMLAGHVRKFTDLQLYYTVHDVRPHEVRLNFLSKVKHYFFRIRKDKQLVRRIDNLVTNSPHQKLTLSALFPDKSVFLHDMPSLVTPGLKKGNAKVSELRGCAGYVLFFGKIEFYKGLHLLYQVFTQYEALRNIKLVVAGSGNIYFPRSLQSESNIIFINRYIQEQEMNDLFSNALALVMPYISATQSGVSSLAYHYNLPVIASDIEGLNETIIHEVTGLLFRKGDPKALVNCVIRLNNDYSLLRELCANLREEKLLFYKPIILTNQLTQIYSGV